jgi:hypothetical protein
MKPRPEETMTIDRDVPKTAAPRILTLICLAASMAGSAGCAGRNTIEPGLWRLKIETQQGSESKRYVRKPRDVTVEVEWSAEEKDTENMRVSYSSRNEDQTVERALLGKIEGKELTLEGYDLDWYIMLKGRVYTPGSIGGSAFGRVRWKDDIYFTGTWTMVRAEEQD